MNMSDEVVRGVDGMSDVLKCSPKTVESYLTKYPSFPARRESSHGVWLSTRNALLEWMGLYVRGKIGGTRKPKITPRRATR